MPNFSATKIVFILIALSTVAMVFTGIITGDPIDNPQTEMDFIETQFKEYADKWFAQPLVNQAIQNIEQVKIEQVALIQENIANSTTIETE